MRQKSKCLKEDTEMTVENNQQWTCKQHSAEERAHIVLADLHREDSIANPCRPERNAESLYSNWPKEVLKSGKKQLGADTTHD